MTSVLVQHIHSTKREMAEAVLRSGRAGPNPGLGGGASTPSLSEPVGSVHGECDRD